MSSVSATTSNHFVFVDSLGPATWVRLADGTVIVVEKQVIPALED